MPIGPALVHRPGGVGSSLLSGAIIVGGETASILSIYPTHHRQWGVGEQGGVISLPLPLQHTAGEGWGQISHAHSCTCISINRVSSTMLPRRGTGPHSPETPGPAFPTCSRWQGVGWGARGVISPLPMPPWSRQTLGLTLPLWNLQSQLTCTPTSRDSSILDSSF